MFVKFTRLDGTPIWLNSTFVVTVEPRRGGGSVVVPIGDGLDYDVREAPDRVLAMLEPSGPAPQAAPRPEAVAAELVSPRSVVAAEGVSPSAVVTEGASPDVVVAVPPPKALPEKFADVVSQGLSAPQPDEIDSKPVEPAKESSAVKIVVSPAAEPAPAKKTVRKRKTKAETADGASADAAPVKPKKATRARKSKKPELALDAAQVERLRRMAPGSLKKLQNTLASQFRIEDVDGTITALVAGGVIALEQDHVVYKESDHE